jgi:hypothetical protein
MSVTFDANAPDGFLVNSFANDDWQDCRDHVRRRLSKMYSARTSSKQVPGLNLCSPSAGAASSNGSQYARSR